MPRTIMHTEGLDTDKNTAADYHAYRMPARAPRKSGSPAAGPSPECVHPCVCMRCQKETASEASSLY
jgi:hypothetical protein